MSDKQIEKFEQKLNALEKDLERLEKSYDKLETQIEAARRERAQNLRNILGWIATLLAGMVAAGWFGKVHL